MPMLRNSSRRSGLPAVAKISAPTIFAIAIAAWPTPPVPEWISTLSSAEILASSYSPYHAVPYAVAAAAPWTVVTVDGTAIDLLANIGSADEALERISQRVIEWSAKLGTQVDLHGGELRV